MSSKRKIFLVGVIFILLVILSVVLIFIPKISIKIKGDKDIILNINEEYEELGAQAFLKKGIKIKKIPVDIIGNVDNTTLGKYTVIYKATYKNIIKTERRVINVVDNKAPIITLNKPIIVCKNNNLVEIDAKAIDNIDGDISESIKYKINDNKIIVFVMDSSNNKAEITNDLIYADNEKPIIVLNGGNTINLNVGSTYNEQGAKAYDSCDGNITEKIQTTGNVDSNIPGEYTIVYKVSDSLNNETSITRKIIVSENEIDSQAIGESVIYLTFDDGPGPYTGEILNILDKYGIKATFFVTNQFGNSNYLSYIKDEYEKGHTVGIHTYSHKWSIYDSLDNYLNDFEKIKDIVVSQTGVEPKYFRFPGGTSNHVAKISMANLSKLMTEKGYVYFDWNVSVEDAGSCTKKKTDSEKEKCIINNFKKGIDKNKNNIVLMHDIKKNTLKVLPEIISYAKSNGYTFKPIDENTPLKQFNPYN